MIVPFIARWRALTHRMITSFVSPVIDILVAGNVASKIVLLLASSVGLLLSPYLHAGY